MPPRVLAVLAALAGAAATLASCGEGDEATPSTATAAAPADQAPGDGLLTFEAQAIDGSSVDVGSYSGEDLAIWFWAPW